MDVGDWEAARAAVCDCGLSAANRAIGMARQHNVTPDELIAICQEYRKYADKLKSPGAIFYRITEGTWPIDPPPSGPHLTYAPKPRDPKPKSWLGSSSITAPMTEEQKRDWEQSYEAFRRGEILPDDR